MNLNFVLSPDFHGTTALALLLNNHSRISALGDGNPFAPFDGICACRSSFRECAFWSEIRRRLDTDGFADRLHLLPLYPDTSGNTRIDAFLSKGLSLVDVYWNMTLWDFTRANLKKYSRLYLDFYRAVCDIQGTDLFVSGSKNLTEILVQRRFAEDIDRIKVIHVARDPRGYVCSARKNYGHGVRKATRSWRMWHGAFRRLDAQRSDIDYLFVRHEDFCREPRELMERIFSFLGVESEDVCKPPAHPRKHHIAGHEMAYAFNGSVRQNDSWRTLLTGEQQREILERTRPLSEMFGYTGGIERERDAASGAR